jgi:hypothetical protein
VIVGSAVTPRRAVRTALTGPRAACVLILGLDVVDAAGFEHRLKCPNIPDLIGFAGSARIGGISRPRARRLGETHPDHPRPILDIEGYGPLRSEVVALHETRQPMKSGPAPRTAASESDTREVNILICRRRRATREKGLLALRSGVRSRADD